MFVSISSKDPQTVENLGGKGFGLWQMSQSGLNVPPALVIPTSVCVDYMKKPVTVMKEIAKRLPEVYSFFQQQMGYMPLLSVRSGARVSMPGMMDTILNVGLDESTLAFWQQKLGADCVKDSYGRLIEMYGSVVENIERSDFDGLDLEGRMKVFTQLAEKPFPNIKEQLLGSIEAVFKSWNNERAKVYRKMHSIPEDWGTAVVLQAMVFGNLNDQSATGVLFTRNPDTGLAKVTGEFLVNAQGEDVVAGIKTPLPLEEMSNWNDKVSCELHETVLALEASRKDVQDVEFTIQDGKLYILQTRNAKRSAQAAVVIAMDMVKEGMLTPAEAVGRVSRAQYAMLQQPVIDPKFKGKHVWSGISACSGVASGIVVKSAAAAINCKVPCMLVTEETTPDDIAGMVAAKGVVTMHGGGTSHAAVVARGMNKPCIVGVGASLESFTEGEVISIDGGTGRIWKGEIPVVDNSNSPELAAFKQLLLEVSGCKVIDSNPATSCDLLDVTDLMMDPEKVVSAVKQRLSKPGDFIVDMVMEEDSEIESFFGCFVDPAGLEQAVETKLNELSPADKARFRLLCSTKNKLNLQKIMTVQTLEELIVTDGSFVMQGTLKSISISDPVQKVLKWKKAEGAIPMSFGKKTEGESFLSQEQIVAALLV